MINRTGRAINVVLGEKDLLIGREGDKLRFQDIGDKDHKVLIEFTEETLRNTIDTLNYLYYSKFYKEKHKRDIEITKSILEKKREVQKNADSSENENK